MNFDPATTSVRRNRAHNCDSDRLLIRRDHLLWLVFTTDGSRTIPNRLNFAMRAAELSAIEDVLLSRGDLAATDRRTTTHGG
jgi:hypothetical protein